ncbi:conserved protein of unknown function [Citrobacter amalonaticus]|uniref:Uncharacterized protein n=1 Tax=Citrobacter amalonaticus TaxID=35703 RepID=A0AAX2BI88_CITAM|nr:conserved protein of unknown function [Citrobacter amalonaticus]
MQKGIVLQLFVTGNKKSPIVVDRITSYSHGICANRNIHSPSCVRKLT